MTEEARDLIQGTNVHTKLSIPRFTCRKGRGGGDAGSGASTRWRVALEPLVHPSSEHGSQFWSAVLRHKSLVMFLIEYMCVCVCVCVCVRVCVFVHACAKCVRSEKRQSELICDFAEADGPEFRISL